MISFRELNKHLRVWVCGELTNIGVLQQSADPSLPVQLLVI